MWLYNWESSSPHNEIEIDRSTWRRSRKVKLGQIGQSGKFRRLAGTGICVILFMNIRSEGQTTRINQ